MENPTQFTSLGYFDSKIPSTAIQTVTTVDDQVDVSEAASMSTTLEWLYSQGIFQSDVLKERYVSVQVDRDDGTCYQHISTGSYYVDVREQTSAIKSISVDPSYRNRGYGRQMKQTIENHLRQEPQSVQYTAIVSEGGQALIDPYPYEFVTSLTDEIDVYKKEL